MLDHLHPIRATDCKDASLVLGRAFAKDPLMTAVISDSRHWQEMAPILFHFMIRFGIRYGEVCAPSPQLEGVSIWFHSSRAKMTFPKIVRTGLSEMIRHIDLKTLNRYRILWEQLDKVRARLTSDEHWYLCTIGVDPSHQGSGCAGSMLRPMLGKIDGARLPCYLETGVEKNVALYARYGFGVIEQFEVYGIPTWAMLRERE